MGSDDFSSVGFVFGRWLEGDMIGLVLATFDTGSSVALVTERPRFRPAVLIVDTEFEDRGRLYNADVSLEGAMVAVVVGRTLLRFISVSASGGGA